EACKPAFDAVYLETDIGADHHSWLELYRQLLEIRHREIMPRLQGAQALGCDVLSEGAVSARWRMGDGTQLRIDLNLSEHAVTAPKWHPASVLFETLPHAAELSRRGTLNPYTAIVSLIAIDVLERQDEQ